MNKDFSKIWMIVIAAVLIAGGILAWQYFRVPEEGKAPEELPEVKLLEVLPEEVADWKIYRNKEYGFEIKYPDDWKVNEINKKFVSFITPGREPEIEFPGDITIHISENPHKLTIKDFYDGKSGGPDLFTGTKNIISISIAGTIGMKFKGVQGLTSSTVTVISKDNFFIEIEDVVEYYQDNGIYDQMLSTFRFSPH